jgi:hypothetical protein
LFREAVAGPFNGPLKMIHEAYAFRSLALFLYTLDAMISLVRPVLRPNKPRVPQGLFDLA